MGEGSAASTADFLLANEQAILARYRERLVEINSPLVSDEERQRECMRQASTILRTRSSGPTAYPASPASWISVAADYGDVGRRFGIPPVDSLRAGACLVDACLDMLGERAEQTPGAQDAYVTVSTIVRGMIRWLEGAALGYDVFLADGVAELQERAMRGIARDLHDEIGNSLSLALRQIELLEMTVAPDDAVTRRYADGAKIAVTEGMDRVRELVTGMRKRTIASPLETALQKFVASMGQSAPQVHIWVHGSESQLSSIVQEGLFLAIRECIRNVFRHAKASTVYIRVSVSSDCVHAEILDDGNGFDIEAAYMQPRANGLTGTREGIEMLNGTFNIVSEPGKGTRATIWIPGNREAKENGQR